MLRDSGFRFITCVILILLIILAGAILLLRYAYHQGLEGRRLRIPEPIPKVQEKGDAKNEKYKTNSWVDFGGRAADGCVSSLGWLGDSLGQLLILP